MTPVTPITHQVPTATVRPGDEPTAEEFAAAARKHNDRAETLRAQAETAPSMLAETYRRRAAELELAAFVQQVRAEAKGYPAPASSAA